MGSTGSAGSLLLAGLIGIPVGAALLGSALLALRARRAVWLIVVVAALLGCATLAGLIWAVVVSGSLLIAALAVGAAVGSGCGAAVTFSVLLSAWLVGDWRHATRALLGRTPLSGTARAPEYPGSHPSGYPSGYPGAAPWGGREGFPGGWADPRSPAQAAERRR